MTTESDSKLEHKAVKSIFWSVGGSIFISLIRFLGTAVLARILLATDFGLVGIAMVLFEMVQLFGQIYLSGAIIYYKDRSQVVLSTAYWANIGLGILLWCIASFIAAPIGAVFYNAPELKIVVPMVALSFIFSAMASIHYTLLTKELRFKTLTVIELISAIVRVVVALTAVYFHCGFWAIVYGMLAERILKTIIMFFVLHWKPTLQFSFPELKKLLKFSGSIYAQSFVEYFNNNIDYLVIGKLLGLASLAYYQFAYNIPHLILYYVTYNAAAVLFPFYSGINEDKNRVLQSYLATCKFISLVTFPAMLGLAFCAEAFIVSLYGARWQPSIAPLKILCISACFRSVFSTGYILMRSQGKPGWGFIWSLIFLPISVVTVIPLGKLYGATGVAAAMTFVAFLQIFIVMASLRLVHGNLKEFLKELIPGTFCSIAMLGVLWIFSKVCPYYVSMNSWVRLALSIVVGAAAYAALLRCFYKETFDQLLNFLKSLKKQKAL